jgi:hypothetical protein
VPKYRHFFNVLVVFVGSWQLPATSAVAVNSDRNLPSRKRLGAGEIRAHPFTVLSFHLFGYGWLLGFGAPIRLLASANHLESVMKSHPDAF